MSGEAIGDSSLAETTRAAVNPPSLNRIGGGLVASLSHGGDTSGGTAGEAAAGGSAH